MAYTAIDDPEAYFQTQLYTGNGSADHAITFGGDTDMQPDFVWIKNRDAADSHCLFDSVRGATKVLHSDANNAESTDTDTLDSFATDGFQVDADVKVNTNAEDYVAWCWKAGTTSGITATGATITPTAYSFNQTSGFSIIQYTGNVTSGAKVPHGLGVAPRMIITKKLGAINNWVTQHAGVNGGSSPENYAMSFNQTYAQDRETYYWNDTAPDAVNFTLGNSDQVNDSGNNGHIAFCFTDVAGYSKFGYYIGNGNADGTFIYTGFRPAYIMTKAVSAATYDWVIIDNKRDPFNVADESLYGNLNSAVATSNHLDILSNGFKMRSTAAGNNGSGTTFIYMAFAEAPFVNSNGVPCNAR